MNWRPWRWIAWVGKAEKMPWRQLLESQVFKDLSPRYRYTQESDPPTGLTLVKVEHQTGFPVLIHGYQLDELGREKTY